MCTWVMVLTRDKAVWTAVTRVVGAAHLSLLSAASFSRRSAAPRRQTGSASHSSSALRFFLLDQSRRLEQLCLKEGKFIGGKLGCEFRRQGFSVRRQTADEGLLRIPVRVSVRPLRYPIGPVERGLVAIARVCCLIG